MRFPKPQRMLPENPPARAFRYDRAPELAFAPAFALAFAPRFTFTLTLVLMLPFQFPPPPGPQFPPPLQGGGSGGGGGSHDVQGGGSQPPLHCAKAAPAPAETARPAARPSIHFVIRSRIGGNSQT